MWIKTELGPYTSGSKIEMLKNKIIKVLKGNIGKMFYNLGKLSYYGLEIGFPKKI